MRLASGSTLRVAIVHDWLTSMRGGERVVEVLCDLFPDAHLFTLTWDPARLSPSLAARPATTSAIHRVATAPFVNGRFRALLPLFPLAVESFDLEGYDLVLSSSHCVALGALAPPRARRPCQDEARGMYRPHSTLLDSPQVKSAAPT